MLKFLIGVCPRESAARAVGLIAAIARRDDWVHLYTHGFNTTPLQRAMAIFTNMDEFHVSWDYSDATEGLAKTAILGYAERHCVDIIVMGRNNKVVHPRGPRLSRDLLSASIGTAHAVWLVTKPINAFPPTYMLCLDDSPEADRALRLVQRLLIPGAIVWVFGWYKAKQNSEWQTGWIDSVDDPNGSRAPFHSGYSTSTQYAARMPRTSSHSRHSDASTRCSDHRPPPRLQSNTSGPEGQPQFWVHHARDMLLETVPGVQVATCVMGTRNVGRAVLEFAKAKNVQTIICANHIPTAFSRFLGKDTLGQYLLENTKEHAILFVN
jgi:hypothetical protein